MKAMDAQYELLGIYRAMRVGHVRMIPADLFDAAFPGSEGPTAHAEDVAYLKAIITGRAVQLPKRESQEEQARKWAKEHGVLITMPDAPPFLWKMAKCEPYFDKSECQCAGMGRMAPCGYCTEVYGHDPAEWPEGADSWSP